MITGSSKATLYKNSKWVVIAFWLISTFVYLCFFGIVTTQEAGKYIEEANHFINYGNFSAPRFWFYSITIFILAFSIKIKIGFIGAFIIQALINLFAYLLFHKALQKLFQQSFAPVFITIYLLIFWPFQSWVVYLYTESVFFSAVMILFSVLVLYKPDNIKNISLIILALLFVTISRPLGILFVLSVCIYLFYCAHKKWKIILACGLAIVIATGYFATNIIFATIKDWSITQAFEQESIICDLPSAGPYTKLDLANYGSPVYHLYYYVTHNFSHFLHFAGAKLQYFFLMKRDYYSPAHNYFLLINAITIYLLAFTGLFIKRLKINKGIILFMAGSILLFAITIIFQCDDYNNRFILPLFPFFLIMAARGAEYFISLLFKNSK